MPQLQRRTGATAVPVSAIMQQQGGLSTRDVQNIVNAEPWVYHDTLIVSAGTVPPASGAFNFAQWVNPITFFDARTQANSGVSITNVGDKGKLEADFICLSLQIDVYCDEDVLSAPGIATAVAFAETLIQYGVIVVSFGPVVKTIRPVVDCPAGGGAYVANKVRTAGAGAFTDAGNALNGFPSSQSRRMLPEPIFFEKGQAFSMALYVDDKPTANASLTKIQGLPPLSGTQKAMVRVKMEGKRGSPLMVGTPRSA